MCFYFWCREIILDIKSGNCMQPFIFIYIMTCINLIGNEISNPYVTPRNHHYFAAWSMLEIFSLLFLFSFCGLRSKCKSVSSQVVRVKGWGLRVSRDLWRGGETKYEVLYPYHAYELLFFTAGALSSAISNGNENVTRRWKKLRHVRVS